MVKVCSLCGDSGYEDLLMTCFKCKSASIHPYCTFPIVFDASFDWVCEDCCPQTLDNVETSKKRVKRSSNMDAPPTLPPNDHFQGQNLCKKKKQKRVKNPVHAHQGQNMCKKKKQKRVKNPVHAAHQVILHDPEHIKRYEALKGRRIVNTRYLDASTLDALGLREDIEWMAEQVGWTRFLTMKEPTYISLTLEFLSSVSVNLPRRGPCHDALITFRLNNQNRELSLEQFNAIFGFCNGGDRVKNPKGAGYDPNEFWREITDEKDFDPTKSHATLMYNPCFRVMQRLMASTVFARSNKCFVRSEELLHLWAMVHGHNVDSGAFLALQLQTVGRAKTGNVEIGGIVTSIARSLGVVDMEGLEEVKGKNRRIDLGSLRNMIENEEGQYKLRLTRIDKLWTLPDPANTTVKVRENWKHTFKGGMEDGEDLDQSARDGVGRETVDLEAIHAVLKAQQGEMDEIRNMVSQIMGKKKPCGDI